MGNNWLGLGVITNPFDPTGASSTTTFDKSILSTKTSTLIINQSARNFLGSTPITQKLSEESKSTSNRLTNLTTSPFNISKNSFSFLGGKNSAVTMVPDSNPLVFSKESGPGTNETLFIEFHLDALPFYNFWVEDETTNDNDSIGDRKLSDVPRFIKVVWDSAPEIKSREIEVNNKKIRFKLTNAKKIISSGIMGNDYKPDHLQPDNFSLIGKSLSNSTLNGPIINAVIEIPEVDNGIDILNDIIDPSDTIEEDLFLTHPDLKGINLSELRLNVFQPDDAIFNTSTNFGRGTSISNDLSDVKESVLMSGKMDVIKPTNSNKYLQIRSIDPELPTIQLKSRVPQKLNSGDEQDLDFVKKISDNINTSKITNSTFIRTKFINSGITGINNQSRLDSISKPEHAETMISINSFLPQLELLSQLRLTEIQGDIDEVLSKIPNFPAPNGINEVEYIGYQIEKSRMKNGKFELVEVLDVPDRESNEFYDSKIIYGETYRYRIRSIVRWARAPKNAGLFSPTTNSHTTPTLPLICSYFHSEWSAPYAQATILDMTPPDPPDELNVIPQSHKKRIMITMKIPRNPQHDITRMHLYRKLKDENGNDLTNWVPIRTELPFRNNLVLDYDVDFFEENKIQYVYAAVCDSLHNEQSLLSEQYSAKLCKDWRVIGEYNVEFISNAGVRRDNFGSFSTKPVWRHKSEVKITQSEENLDSLNFVVSNRDTYTNRSYDDQTYLMRVESLDTGETDDIYIEVGYNNVKTETVKSATPISQLKRKFLDRRLPFFGRLF
jgi:hypothetical protein